MSAPYQTNPPCYPGLPHPEPTYVLDPRPVPSSGTYKVNQNMSAPYQKNPPCYPGLPHPEPLHQQPPYLGPPGTNQPPATYVVYPGQATHIQGPSVVPNFIQNQNMGYEPCVTMCKSCNQQTRTRVERTANTKTHLYACLLFLLGFWCCCCIPYCVDSCNDADHYCSYCGSFVGSYKG